MTQQTDRLNTALAGRYRIEGHLGEGGMASVYLCEDLKHDRKVALKLLKPELAAVLGADRFVVEIKTTASLQHPHILPLFDSGTADGFLFYVMPLVEGETLREKLNRETQLGVDEAIRIAREVLDALQYAHEHGIVHRDVKPENILLHGGHAMVADFGIALAVSAAAGGRMTETGLSLGTPHYMSPEQATAEKEITPRSDVYSVATVLYEMLAGQPPHVGGAAQQVIMKIITEHAQPVRQHRKNVPANVDAAIAKALEKLPADRFESAAAFGAALVNPTYSNDARAQALGHRGISGAGVSRRTFAAAVTTLAIVALGALAWGFGGRAGEVGGHTVRFFLTLDAETRMSGDLNVPAISPDGRLLVFGAVRGGRQMLYSRAIDDTATHPVPGTEYGRSPFFSPDGKSLGFFALGWLKRVDLAGGAVVPIAEVSSMSIMRGAVWTKHGMIIIGMLRQMMSVSAAGGSLKSVAPLDTANGELAQRWPLVLDDGETIVYTSTTGSIGRSSLGVISLSKGTERPLGISGTNPLGVLEGQLIYVSGTGALMAVPFDSRRARATGPSVALGERVQFNAGTNGGDAAMSGVGTLVYQSGNNISQLVEADSLGRMTVLVHEAKAYSYPRFSPDGKRIAVGVANGSGTDLMIYDLAAGTSLRLTTEGNNDRAEWTPDGKKVLYYATGHPGQKSNDIRWQASDGGGTASQLVAIAGSPVQEGVVSPDGKAIAFRINSASSVQDLWYRRLEGDTVPRPIVVSPAIEMSPRFSPDGRWLAYDSDRSGVTEVYVQSFPELGAPIPVTAGGGQQPLWGRDGRHIYYIANNQINEATVSTAPGFTVLSRKAFFEVPFTLDESGVHAAFDIAHDGKRFLLTRPINGLARTIVVHDWQFELRARSAQAAKK